MRQLWILGSLTLVFALGIGGGIYWLRSQDGSSLSQILDARNPFQFRLPRALAGAVGDYGLSDAKGQVVVVNFWASWCEPCQREFPSLLKLGEQKKIKILLVAENADRKDIEKFLGIFGRPAAGVEVLWDADSTVAKRFGTYQLPESYIFSPEGEMKRKVTGFADWTQESVIKFLDDLIVKPPPT